MLRILYDHWKEISSWFVGFGALVAGGWKVYQKAVSPFLKWVKELSGHQELIEDIDHQLKILNGKFAAVIEELPMAIFENNSDGICISVNREWSELTGLDKNSATGNGWARIVHPDSIRELRKTGEDFVKYGKSLDFNFKVIHFDTKEVFEVQCKVNKQTDEQGKVVAIIGTLKRI
jgi:PAS domain S-box-containing protein